MMSTATTVVTQQPQQPLRLRLKANGDGGSSGDSEDDSDDSDNGGDVSSTNSYAFDEEDMTDGEESGRVVHDQHKETPEDWHAPFTLHVWRNSKRRWLAHDIDTYDREHDRFVDANGKAVRVHNKVVRVIGDSTPPCCTAARLHSVGASACPAVVRAAGGNLTLLTSYDKPSDSFAGRPLGTNRAKRNMKRIRLHRDFCVTVVAPTAPPLPASGKAHIARELAKQTGSR